MTIPCERRQLAAELNKKHKAHIHSSALQRTFRRYFKCPESIKKSCTVKICVSWSKFIHCWSLHWVAVPSHMNEKWMKLLTQKNQYEINFMSSAPTNDSDDIDGGNEIDDVKVALSRAEHEMKYKKFNNIYKKRVESSWIDCWKIYKIDDVTNCPRTHSSVVLWKKKLILHEKLMNNSYWKNMFFTRLAGLLTLGLVFNYVSTTLISRSTEDENSECPNILLIYSEYKTFGWASPRRQLETRGGFQLQRMFFEVSAYFDENILLSWKKEKKRRRKSEMRKIIKISILLMCCASCEKHIAMSPSTERRVAHTLWIFPKKKVVEE